MPRPRRHYLDDLADDLFEHLEREVEALVEAFKGGMAAPGAAPITEAQKLDLYRSMMLNKDGTPNESGRQQVMARVGIQQYVDILKALAAERGDRETSTAPFKPPAPPVTGVA